MTHKKSIWKIPLSLDEINQRAKGTLSDHLRITFVNFTENSLTAAMPISPELTQPMGILHGGASCALAETVGSAAANYCIDPEHWVCVGLEINVNHIRAISSGELLAKATPYHLGKSTQVWNIEIYSHQGMLIAISRLTIAVLKKQ